MDYLSGSDADLAALVEKLGGIGDGADDADRIDLIAGLERLKSAAAAAQMRITAAFDCSQRQAQAAAGWPQEWLGAGIAGQIGLAKRETPNRAARFVARSTLLVTELPGTLDALARGETTESRADVVAREAAWLSPADRAALDGDLAPKLGGWSDSQTEAEARRAGYRLDPAGYSRRIRIAQRDRGVTMRPAPDAMARVSALVPAKDGVAVMAALRKEADAVTAAGDGRTRGQVMADTLVERATGQTTAQGTPVEVQLVMSDEALLGGGDEPAEVIGYGPIPAELAREWVAGGPDVGVWVRRLYTRPDGRRLVAMDSTRRLFPAGMRRFITLRDGRCRTPWCGAPIRHIDHVRDSKSGGATSETNGQGLCATCNYGKQAPDWQTTADPAMGAGESVTITTPTGHTYVSTPPDVLGRSGTARRRRSPARPTPVHKRARRSATQRRTEQRVSPEG